MDHGKVYPFILAKNLKINAMKGFIIIIGLFSLLQGCSLATVKKGQPCAQDTLKVSLNPRNGFYYKNGKMEFELYFHNMAGYDNTGFGYPGKPGFPDKYGRNGSAIFLYFDSTNNNALNLKAYNTELIMQVIPDSDVVSATFNYEIIPDTGSKSLVTFFLNNNDDTTHASHRTYPIKEDKYDSLTCTSPVKNGGITYFFESYKPNKESQTFYLFSIDIKIYKKK